MNKIYLVAYLVYITGILAYAWMKPYYNWDMIPYIAAARSFEHHDKKQIHEEVYEDVKKFVPPHVYAEMIQGDYRQTMLSDAEAFYQQIPFYKPKLLYVWLIHVLTQFGFNSITAMSILSVVPSFIASLLILLFLLNEISGVYPYVISVLIINVSGILDIARLFTPDSFSACIVLLAMFLILRKKHFLWGSSFLLLSIFIRVDNLLFCFMCLTYLRFFGSDEYRLNNIVYIVTTALCAVSYIIISYGTKNYGWTTLIHHVTVNKIVTPESFQPAITLFDYIVIVFKRGFIQFVTNPLVSFFLIMGLSTRYLLTFTNRDSKILIYGHIIALMALSIVVHFVLFPDLLSRYFATQYAMGAIAFSITLFHIMKSKQTNQFGEKVDTK